MTLVCGWDLETSGKDPSTCRIVQIACVIRDWETNAVKLSYDRRVDPGVHIEPGATRVHGIADADVMGMPKFSDLAPVLMKVLSNASVLGGHNIVDFDLVVLANELNRIGMNLGSLKAPEIVDTIGARWATPDGKSPSLADLAWAVGVEYDHSKAHDALWDVNCWLDCYREAVRLGMYPAPKQKEI